MGKRLRRKIREACDLEKLSKDEKKKRAAEIIDDYDYKQSICVRVPGVTHKAIDRTMKGILANKQPEKTEEDMYPEKYGNSKDDRDWQPGAKTEYTTLTREDVQWLIKQSQAEFKPEEREVTKYHRTWSREEVAALIRADYHPDKFRYLDKKKK